MLEIVALRMPLSLLNEYSALKIRNLEVRIFNARDLFKLIEGLF